MTPKLIAINALTVILILTLAPSPTEIYLTLALYALNCALYYYKKGGRWTDDYSKTLCNTGHWQKEERRIKMEGYCLSYRVSIIGLGLMLAAVVVL